MGTLGGARVVVTRAAHQAEELAAPLRERGAEVLLLPAIGIAPPLDGEPLRRAARACNSYNWIVFTSVNAIDAFAAELGERHMEARIATVGMATREAAEQRGWHVSLTPEKYVAEALVAAFADQDLQGCRVLIPGAAVRRDVVAKELGKRGAEVTVIEAYRNVLPPGAESNAALVFRAPYPDWVTFASASAAENLIRLSGVETLRAVKVASIGPITSEAVARLGLTVNVEAAEHSMMGLVWALEQCERGREGAALK